MEHLWYASFGSNLSWARFEKYLKGGSAELASHSFEPGARDPSDPIDETLITLDREMFFAYRSQKWDGGGVAFLASDRSENETICRVYKITVQQFEDVHMQESGRDEPAELDVEELLAAGSLQQYDSLYGLALLVGEHSDGLPIVTITTARTDLELNSPSVGYAATIALGLVESTSINPEDAVDYVLSRNGVDTSLRKADVLEAMA